MSPSDRRVTHLGAVGAAMPFARPRYQLREEIGRGGVLPGGQVGVLVGDAYRYTPVSTRAGAV
jgi:hypothetical protein